MTPPAVLLALAFLAQGAASQPLGDGTTAPIQAADPATLTQDAKTLLGAEQLRSALADAEAAVAAGGGADALAARAEAKLALGRPLAEALQDYEAAARLDPRYGEKYQGLLAQLKSETSPDRPKDRKRSGAGGIGMGVVGGLAAAGVLLLAFGLLFVRRKKSAGKSAAEL
jgi:hypothetical protein